ncbi:glycosyltransferase [Fibrella aestuarina]|uniref:Glycosyltransferase n=1 Tax=Fibrivirga algicola TaxID=2950420 RepID=A0ABX0QCM6_9BACT|nr:glycosyltransferase [Fibrivirga algicola]
MSEDTTLHEKTTLLVSPAIKRDVRLLRRLILVGLVFTVLFLWVYIQPANRGDSWLFSLLTISVLFKLLRLLHEWYHYWTIYPSVPPAATRTWTVDVLTTYCPGEPLDMVETTLRAIQAIRYPHTTYLCDEADDPYLRHLCTDLGIKHVTRTDKQHAKAGNINNALKQATGDICLVLDPDHVPVPEFLHEVLPYFADEQVGFVQCVQAYSNRKASIVAYGAAEQTYSFYGPMMISMGQYGTAQAIGANCTFRRAALDSIGGHAAGLSEDMHTAMQLHAKKWTSVYVPKPLSYGLVPATLASYYKQQLKWARGTFELLVTTYPALFRHFTWRQRVHYGTLPLYYLLGLVQLIDFALPIVSLLLMKLPLRLDLPLFAAVYMPLLLTGFLIRQFAQRWLTEPHEAGFHVVGGLLSSGTWWIYLLGLIYTIFRVDVPYLPTPKNDQPRNNVLLCLPNALFALVTVLTIGYSVYFFGRYAFGNIYMQMMIGFGLVNLLILGSNVLIGQEKLLLGMVAWLGQTRVNRRLGRPVRYAIWRGRYGLYGWLRSSVVWLLGGLVLLTSGLGNYLYRQQKATELPYGVQYATTQPFYIGYDSSVPVANASTLDLLISPQHLPWPKAAGRPATPNWPVNARLLPLLYIELQLEQRATDEAIRAFLQDIRQKKNEAVLAQFANDVKEYKRPVLLSFAPYFDDSTRLWGTAEASTRTEYQQTWQYLVRYFRAHDVSNVSWVWCPANPETLTYFNPAADTIDWIGTDVLHESRTNNEPGSHSFAALFQAMHNAIRFHPVYELRQKPVLITRLYPANSPRQTKWINDALTAIQDRYTEVKGVVFTSE